MVDRESTDYCVNKGSFPRSWSTRDKHARMSFVVTCGSAVNKRGEEVGNGGPFGLATGHLNFTIVTGRAKQSTDANMQRK